jgi:type II secretory pathway pseudopilin PulG
MPRLESKALSRSRGGFSLVEAMIAVGISVVLTSVAYTALTAHRVQNKKAVETSIMQGFAESYLEYLRNQPYGEILPGRPINSLYAPGNTPNPILVPAAGAWESLSDDNYTDGFYPDLLQMSAREPEFQVAIEERLDGDGNPRSKHIRLTARWERLVFGGGALSETPRLTLQFDTTVFPDFR